MARPSAAPAALDVHAVATAVTVTLFVLIVAHFVLQALVRSLKSIVLWHRRAFVLRAAPMAPGYMPFIGHTVPLFKAVGNYPCTWDLFATWASKTAPKPVRVQIFTRHCVVIADPSTMKRVMSSNMKNYAKDTEFSYAPFLEILGNGLVTSGGDEWKQMRGHISKALRVDILDEIIAIANRAVGRLCAKLDQLKNTNKKIDMENEFRLLTLQVIGEAILSLQPEESDTLFPSLYLPIMDECNARSILDEIIAIANRAVGRLCAKLDQLKNTNKKIDMENEFRLLTLQVIGEAILSLQPEESDTLFPSLYLPIMDECNARSLSPWRAWLIASPEWWRHKSRVKQLDAAIINIVRKRWRARQSRGKGEEVPDDILERVLEPIDPKTYGSSIETQLCFEIKTFLLAGHETSAAMLTWTLHELSIANEKMQKVKTECDAIFKPLNLTTLPSRDAVNSLEYTLACLKETLRLYSVVPVVTRVAEQDDDLGGVRVPAGTTIIMSLQGVHHRPDIWSDPLDYKPDRFTDPDFDENEGFKFLPFIQGPRNCLGQYLAMLEARVVLGTLVSRYDFTVAPGHDNGKKHTKAIPIAPANGAWFMVN